MKSLILIAVAFLSANSALAAINTIKEANDAFFSAPEIQAKLLEHKNDGWREDGVLSQTILQVFPGSGSMVPVRRFERLQQNLVRGSETTAISAVFYNTITAGVKWFSHYSFSYFSKSPKDGTFLLEGGNRYWNYSSLNEEQINRVKANFQEFADQRCNPYKAKIESDPQVSWQHGSTSAGGDYIDVDVSANVKCE